MTCIPLPDSVISESIAMPLVSGMRSLAADAAMTKEGTMCAMDAELESGMSPM